MSTLIQKLRTEPALVVATIVSVLALVGVNVSETNADLATQLIVTLVPLIGGLVTRSKVVPASKVVLVEADD